MSNWSPFWDTVLLRDIADFRNGVNFSAASKGRGIKVIGVSNFQNYVDVPYHELDEINPSGVVRPEDLLQDNDFVFVRSNGNRALIGRSLFVRNLSEPVTHSGFTIRLRFISEVMQPEFFAQLIRSDIARNEISHFGSGTNISNLSQEILGSLVVPLPPLHEQRAIAAILSTWDEAITLTTRLIDALQRRKQALMQLLLTGEVRSQWNVVSLSEVTRLIISNVDKVTTEDELMVRLCNYMDVYRNSRIVNSMQFMEGSVTESEFDRFALQKHDVIITKDSETPEDIAQASVVAEDLENVVCGYHLAILRPIQEQIYGPFLRELLMTPDVHHQFVARANGATRYGLTHSAIASASIPIPEHVDEQLRIADLLSTNDAWVEGLEHYAHLLRWQKRGLMQQLLTGAVRVGMDD
ncbi:MAG: restriction endonuclease subunit S [Anaerolineae bacterium]|nr:restriction endonuclease subunit S [Anaerolineae bacterium]